MENTHTPDKNRQAESMQSLRGMGIRQVNDGSDLLQKASLFAITERLASPKKKKLQKSQAQHPGLRITHRQHYAGLHSTVKAYI